MFLQNIRSCAILDTSFSPCSTLTVLPSSFRMYWDRPANVGYDTYIPNNAYGIDYYRVEVSADRADFRTLAGNVTCVIGQNNPVCHFDRRVALVTGLSAGRVYYYRVSAGTIIGDGQYSTNLTSPMILAPVTPSTTCVCTSYTDDTCTACVAASAPASTDANACVCSPGMYDASAV
jgi:hypothetical protein